MLDTARTTAALCPGIPEVEGGAGLDISGLTVQTDCGVQSDERVFATGTTDPDKSPPHFLGGMVMGGGHWPGGGSLGSVAATGALCRQLVRGLWHTIDLVNLLDSILPAWYIVASNCLGLSDVSSVPHPSSG